MTATRTVTTTATEPSGPAAAAEEENYLAEAWMTPTAGPALFTIPAPAPVLAPYLGLVASVLCVLAGGWLLLAPYALDIRRGAAKLPRAAAVDLETGAAIVAVALLSAILFAAALFSRLRPRIDGAEFEMEAQPAQPGLSEPQSAEPDIEPDPEPEQAPELPVAPTRSDSSSALREMLTPLVAALAADLRSQDQAKKHGHGQDSHTHDSHTHDSRTQDRDDQGRRQEP